mgnify:CR=1 FL=1
MSTIPPIGFTWNGEALIPKMPRLADKHLVVGEDYRMVPHEERSMPSHNHYFVSLEEAWNNLSEDATLRFPTVVHFRKFCLIRAGYRDERL